MFAEIYQQFTKNERFKPSGWTLILTEYHL